MAGTRCLHLQDRKCRTSEEKNLNTHRREIRELQVMQLFVLNRENYTQSAPSEALQRLRY
jgi:hypothetical protein